MKVVDVSPQGSPVTLPPGQRRVDGFPRFGTHLHRPAPAIPGDPRITVTGAITDELAIPVGDLMALPRRQLTADFHCVAGWSASDLHWEGVVFATFYRTIIEPALRSSEPVTHIVFSGLDHYESVVCIQDALRDDVLLADHLDGKPLTADHGAPLRLVSPSQYGFISTKHLCRISVHTADPPRRHRSLANRVFAADPRARVWSEERHPNLPGRAVRPLYRLLMPPLRYLCERGAER